jgi:hypothetical protein
VAAEIYRRRAPSGPLLSLLSALPIDAALVSLLAFGPWALLVRAVAGGIFAWIAGPRAPLSCFGAVDDACKRGPWVLFGLLFAAAVHTLTSPWALAARPIGIAAAAIILLVTALVPESAAAAPATLVAGVLGLKSAPAPLLFASLAVGSAADREALKRPRGALALMLLGPAVAAASVLLRVRPQLPAYVRLPVGTARDLVDQAGPIAAAMLALWLLLVLVALFQRGVRGYFAPLRHGHGRRAREAHADHA